MLYPLRFEPVFQERVWGGQRLAELFQKQIPGDAPIGESWEVTDRPEAVSTIKNGPLTGKDLHWVMENHPKELLGKASAQKGRFPLLVKILDARERLSLQVHPPDEVAAKLGGEPKTEMWYIIDARPGAQLYVGLKKGVTRDEFERRLREGSVAECFHAVPVKAGDAMFLPSGRVHAIGEGIVLFEVQQNSDTTYRVFDWNRVGLDGKPRALHIDESLASIDFNDFEPSVIQSDLESEPTGSVKSLVDDPLFQVVLRSLDSGQSRELNASVPVVLGVIQGNLRVQYGAATLSLEPGQFCLVPAACDDVELGSDHGSQYLHAAPR